MTAALQSRFVAVTRKLPVALVALLVCGAAVAQELTVQNESGAITKLTAADIAALPHQAITADDHGRSVRFEGVPLQSLLEKGGVSLGHDSVRGKRLSECVLVEAADGYRVVFALPELDSGFTDRVILLADKADGHPLDHEQGPFRIIVPGEKRMARWVREVTGIKVVQVQ